MSPRPRFTVVTPSLNQVAFVERTIQSVLAQRAEVDVEYLVYDAGSTDGTLEILQRHAEAGDLTLTVEPDRGQADAVNKGLRAATGDLVGFLNSDDLLLPGALGRAAAALAAGQGATWVHGRCEVVDEHDRPIRRWVSAYKDRRCRRYRREALLVENFVSQMTVFWRREAQQQVGLLDPSLHYAFDYDYWLRLSALGAPAFVPEPQAAFRWYAGSKSGARFEEQFREDLAVFRRHAPRDDRWLALRKRLRTAQILAAYRLLRLAGRP